MPLTDKELQVLRMLVAEAQKNEKKDGWLPNVTLPVSSDERRVICDKLLACGCLKTMNALDGTEYNAWSTWMLPINMYKGLPSVGTEGIFYTILKYLYTVGLLNPHTRASSLTFIFPVL